MPGVTSPTPRTDAGGTALPDRRRPTLLLVAAVLAAVVAVAAVVILMRNGGAGDSGDDTPAPEPAARTGEPSQAPVPPVPEDPGVAVRGGASAAALVGELQARRLWANVEVQGTTAVVHTAYCADPGMDEALAAAAAGLTAGGIESIRCHERHGPLVYERPVRPAPVSAADAGG
jgi:hypothetical protein